MIWIGAGLACAALFAAYGFLALRCDGDCRGPRCSGCPFGEVADEP